MLVPLCKDLKPDKTLLMKHGHEHGHGHDTNTDTPTQLII